VARIHCASAIRRFAFRRRFTTIPRASGMRPMSIHMQGPDVELEALPTAPSMNSSRSARHFRKIFRGIGRKTQARDAAARTGASRS